MTHLIDFPERFSAGLAANKLDISQSRTAVFRPISDLVYLTDMGLLRGSADFRRFFPCHPRIDYSLLQITVFLWNFQSDFCVKNFRVKNFSFQTDACSKQKGTSYL